MRSFASLPSWYPPSALCQRSAFSVLRHLWCQAAVVVRQYIKCRHCFSALIIEGSLHWAVISSGLHFILNSSIYAAIVHRDIDLQCLIILRDASSSSCQCSNNRRRIGEVGTAWQLPHSMLTSHENESISHVNGKTRGKGRKLSKTGGSWRFSCSSAQDVSWNKYE